jgi:hypothetical protein
LLNCVVGDSDERVLGGGDASRDAVDVVEGV